MWFWWFSPYVLVFIFSLVGFNFVTQCPTLSFLGFSLSPSPWGTTLMPADMRKVSFTLLPARSRKYQHYCSVCNVFCKIWRAVDCKPVFRQSADCLLLTKRFKLCYQNQRPESRVTTWLTQSSKRDRTKQLSTVEPWQQSTLSTSQSGCLYASKS